MSIFRYHPEIITTFPGLVGGILTADLPHNPPSSAALQAAYSAEQQAVIARIGTTPLSELPSLNAWRGAFRKFGVDPTQYRSAAEALLRRLTKSGDIPSINTLVDIGNWVSIRYALPVAILDSRAASGGITVHFAAGDEPFTVLNQAETEYPQPGEVVFTNAAREVSARRWCWRQSASSAAREDTTSIIVTVEGHHPAAAADVTSALADLSALLAQYAGATITQQAVLSTARAEV